MSLIHWLPLTNEITDIVRGATIEAAPNRTLPVSGASGKLGLGYTFNNSGVQVNNVQLTGTMSFALWIKLSTHTSCHILDLRKVPGTTTEVGYQPLYYNTSSGIQIYGTAGGSSYIPCSLGTDWHHLAVTLENNKAALYLDGAKKGETSLTGLEKVVDATIGCRATGTTPCPGIIQDVRIYNHALSRAEIKELARAKVLHYTFDDDLACGTTNEAPISGWSTYGSYWTLLARTSDGLKIQRASSTASTVVAVQNSSLKAKMANGDTWTFSCYLYKNGQPYKSSCTEISSPTSYYYKTQSWESREDGYYRNTFKITNTPGTWMLHNNFFGTDAEAGVQYEMRYIQFEKREFATPYVSNTRGGSLENEAGYTCTNSANDVTFTENARIGQRAIYCKDGLQRISATVPYLTADVLSTSLWFKSSNTSPKNGYHILLAVDSGRVEISIPSAGQLRFGGYNKTASNRFCSNFSATLLDGNWHLINTVFDGLTWKGYVDGVLKGTISVTSTKGDSPIVYSNKKLTIGRYYDDATSNYGATDAYIDDVRIYNSVLTLSDIENIYKVGAKITASGDILTNNFVECSEGNLVTANDWLQEGIQDANGVSAGAMANRLATKYIPVLPSTEYYYAVNSGINVRAAHYYAKDLTWIRSDQPTKNSFTAVTPDNCAYVRFVIQYSTASNSIPIANINTYGATMRPAQFNKQLSLATKAEVKAKKNCIFTCLDVCEGHSPQFISNGRATARQIIES